MKVRTIMELLFQVFQFLSQPFTWFWTALVLGVLIGLPDSVTDWLTGKKNGVNVLLLLVVVVVLFTGVFDTSGLRMSNQLGGALAYLLHPFTLVWTLVIVAVVIALPDATTSKWLKQDKAGYALALVAGTAILFLGPSWFGLLLDGSLILGIAIGVAGTVAYYRFYQNRPVTTPVRVPVEVNVRETETLPASSRTGRSRRKLVPHASSDGTRIRETVEDDEGSQAPYSIPLDEE